MGASNWMPEDDFQAIFKAAEGGSTVLEFGPGRSTEAFLLAGVVRIDSCEHVERWFRAATEKFLYEPRVHLHQYVNAPVVTVPELDERRFDVALVDSPFGGTDPHHRVEHLGQEGKARLNTLRYAVERADVVLLHDAQREGERASVAALGLRVEMLSAKLGRVF